MNLKERVNADYLKAFKEKNTVVKNLLSVVKGEIQTVEKNTGSTSLSDEEVIDALSQHVRARGLSLSPEVVLYVLHRFTRDMGTLMQVIDCIDRYAMQHKRTITVALVREMISARSRLS